MANAAADVPDVDVNNSNEEQKEWKEIMGKHIMVKVINEGEGEIAEMGTVVKCSLVGFLANSLDIPFEPRNVQRFKIGEGDAIPGLELSLRHAKVGEVFKVKINSRFGFGPQGRPEAKISDGVVSQPVPADMDLVYDVEVLSHIVEGDIDPSFFDNSESLKKAIHNKEVSAAEVGNIRRLMALSDITLRKECGNRWFSYTDYGRAAQCYSKGTKVADDYFTSVDKHASETSAVAVEKAVDAEGNASRAPINEKDAPMVEAYLSCLNNLAACHLSQGEHLKAKDMCVKVLEWNPNNTKALLRAAKACLALSDYEECKACLDRVLALEPENASALKERLRLKNAERAYKAKSKEISKQIAKGLFPKEQIKGAAADGNITAGTETGTGTSEDVANATSSSSSRGAEIDADASASRNPEVDKAANGNNSDAPNVAATENPTDNPASSSPAPAAASDGAAKTPLKPPENYDNSTLIMLGTSVLVVAASVAMAWYVH